MQLTFNSLGQLIYNPIYHILYTKGTITDHAWSLHYARCLLVSRCPHLLLSLKTKVASQSASAFGSARDTQSEEVKAQKIATKSYRKQEGKATTTATTATNNNWNRWVRNMAKRCLSCYCSCCCCCCSCCCRVGWPLQRSSSVARSVGHMPMRLAPGQVAQSTRSRKCPAVGAAKVRQGEARRGKAGVLSHLVDKTGWVCNQPAARPGQARRRCQIAVPFEGGWGRETERKREREAC